MRCPAAIDTLRSGECSRSERGEEDRGHRAEGRGDRNAEEVAVKLGFVAQSLEASLPGGGLCGDCRLVTAKRSFACERFQTELGVENKARPAALCPLPSPLAARYGLASCRGVQRMWQWGSDFCSAAACAAAIFVSLRLSCWS
jgi:hypothetical protein